MKHSISLLAACILSSAAQAGAVRASPAAPSFQGAWQSPNGSTMLMVVDADGLADVSGYDGESQFRCSGLIVGKILRCDGEFRTTESRRRGHYTSKMILDDSDSISESWKGTVMIDGKSQIQESTDSYKRIGRASESFR